MPGAERLSASAELEKLVRDQMAAGRQTAAICATPAVFLEVCVFGAQAFCTTTKHKPHAQI